MVTNVPNSQERQKSIIEIRCLLLSLKVGEEQLAELINGDQTLFIVNHLVQLLFEVVEDAVVHHILVHHFVQVVLVSFSTFHNIVEVVLDEFATHVHRTLLLADFLECSSTFGSLRQV